MALKFVFLDRIEIGTTTRRYICKYVKMDLWMNCNTIYQMSAESGQAHIVTTFWGHLVFESEALKSAQMLLQPTYNNSVNGNI